MATEKHKQDLQAVKPLIDSVITMRNAVKQYFIQKVRHSYENDLTYEMFQVMVFLWKNDLVNQQDIANAIQKNKASVTPLIDNLCKRQLVTRETDPDNRRNNIIALTDKGREYEKIFIPIQEEYYGKILAEVPAADIQKVVQVLNKLFTITV